MSGTYIAGKFLTNIPAPEILSIIRFFLSSLCFLPFLCFQEFKKLSGAHIISIFIASFFGIFLYNYLFFIAINYTSAINISLVNATIPILTLLISAIIARELPFLKQIIAFILSFIGVGIVMTKGKLDSTIFVNGFGDFLMLLGAFSWVIYGLLIKRLMETLSPLFVTFLSGIFGCIPFLFFSLYGQHWSLLFSLTLRHWIALLYLGIFGTALTFWLYANIIKYLGPKKTNLYIFSLVPIFSTILSFFILGTTINLWQILGCFCVLLALWFNG